MMSRKSICKKWMALALILSMLLSLVMVPVLVGAEPIEGNPEYAREIAAEGMVLLENDGALPLQPGAKVAVFGINQLDYVRGGGGSGQTNIPSGSEWNLISGLGAKDAEGKIEVYQPLVSFYQQAYDAGSRNANEPAVSGEEMQAAKDFAQTAIVTFGRYSSEGSDRSSGKGDYMLSDSEQALIDQVVAAGFENVVVLFNVGGIIDSTWFKGNDDISAVLMAWQGGMMGGLAMADVLCGDVTPSGKLTDTFAKNYTDYPASSNFAGNAFVNYEEDIYVGYRYFETIPGAYDKVNYEFGYGLSYTSFDISEVTAAQEGDDIVVTAKVTNTGAVAGKEVVQVYFSAPQGLLGKPAKELGAYGKTGLLQPGGEETLIMRFPIADMSSYDDLGHVAEAAYVLEAGGYAFHVGNSVRNTVKTEYEYVVEADTITEQLTHKVAPTMLQKRLLADGSYEDLPSDIPYVPYYEVPAEGVTHIEMEGFQTSHDGVAIERFLYGDNAVGYCAAYFNEVGRWVEYNLKVEEAGYYDITWSAANGYATATDTFSVAVNGEKQPAISITMPNTGVGDDGGWYNFVLLDPFKVYLPAGDCTLRYTNNRTSVGNLDYMLIEKTEDAPDYLIPVAAGKSTTFGMNKFAFKADAVRIEEYTVGDETGTCLAYMHTAGNWATYVLDVAEAGTYDLVFRAANGRARVDDFIALEVDGTDQQVNCSIDQTGDGNGASEWYNFVLLDPVTVTLPAGQCELLVVSKSTSFPNINSITLTKQGGEGRRLAAGDTVITQMDVEPLSDIILLKDVYDGRAQMSDFMAQLSNEDLINMSGGQPNGTYSNTGGMGNIRKYGIPNILTADGPQGARLNTTATAWPCSAQLACTWNLEMAEEFGKRVAQECAQYGIDIWLAPGMNIHRDPLCGRNFEYYSEDPLLTGKMAAAVTVGAQSQNVAVAIKHFAGNNKENNRSNNDSRISERALREIYLKGFEIAIKEGGAWTVMSSYNLINGIETAENYELITNILRDEWGFDGLVMTDWGNNSIHALEAKAGNDVKMASGNPANLQAALESGLLTREELERNIERLMNLIMKTNTFANYDPYPTYVPIGDNTRFQTAQNIDSSSGTMRPEASSDAENPDVPMNLGYCDAGQWTQYYIDVARAGSYKLYPRISSNAGAGAFDVEVNGEKIASFTSGGSTGGWQNWVTRDDQAQEIYLQKGRQSLTIRMTESGMNTNILYFEMVEAATALEDLQELYNYTKDADESLYTAASWVPFASALAGANEVMEAADPTEEQIEAAYDALSQAYNALALRALQHELDTLAAFAGMYSQYVEALYTPASWVPFKAALDAANALLADPTNASGPAVGAATEALITAGNNLKEALITSPLEGAIADAEALLAQGGWIPSSAENLQKAIDKAKALLAKEDLTQAEMVSMILELTDAMSHMFEQGNKSSLQLLVNSANRLQQDKFTPASWQAFTNELAAAQVVLDDPNAISEEIAAAYSALFAAIGQLETKANPSGLQTAINLANTILENAGLYIPASIEGLQAERDKAQAVLDNANATQDDVDAAQNALMAKVLAARKPANKEALKGALGKAGKNGTFSQAATDAIALAQQVLADENAPQSTVDAALKAMEEALLNQPAQPVAKAPAETPAAPATAASADTVEKDMPAVTAPAQSAIPQQAEEGMTPAKAMERLGVKETENAAVSPDEVEQRMQAEQIQNPGQGVSFLAVVIATAGLLLLMALAIVWAAKRKGRNE